MVIREIDFEGWQSLEISSSGMELKVPLDIGLRILHCSLPGGKNILYVNPEDRGKKGGNQWRLYGGHRLWFAPEHPEESYEPDNDSVQWVKSAHGILFTQRPGERTGLVRGMELSLRDTELRIVHRARNAGTATRTVSLWTITALCAGGRAHLPLQTRLGSGLNPAAAIVVWPYTSMNDPRLSFGAVGLSIEQRSAAPLKLGVSPLPGSMTLRYELSGLVFEKTFGTGPGPYPDLGTAAQCYTNENLLELEALGPSRTCPPGGVLEFSETWALHSVTPA